MFVHFFNHQGVGFYVIIVPKCRKGKRRVIGCRVDGAILGADDPPTALGLDFSHGGMRSGQHIAHAVAVGNLVESVFGDFGPDLYGFKQNVEIWIAGHGIPLI